MERGKMKIQLTFMFDIQYQVSSLIGRICSESLLAFVYIEDVTWDFK